MLLRFDPFRELDRLSSWPWSGEWRRNVPMDAYRQGDHFVVHLDLPGVDPSSIDLTLEKNVLTVSAERRAEADGDAQVLVAERPRGTFTRQLFLGEALDQDRVEARYEHGVLTLTVPVAETAKPRKVEIQSGSHAAIDAASHAA